MSRNIIKLGDKNKSHIYCLCLKVKL